MTNCDESHACRSGTISLKYSFKLIKISWLRRLLFFHNNKMLTFIQFLYSFQVTRDSSLGYMLKQLVFKLCKLFLMISRKHTLFLISIHINSYLRLVLFIQILKLRNCCYLGYTAPVFAISGYEQKTQPSIGPNPQTQF